jgi:hypothetical protein
MRIEREGGGEIEERGRIRVRNKREKQGETGGGGAGIDERGSTWLRGGRSSREFNRVRSWIYIHIHVYIYLYVYILHK